MVNRKEIFLDNYYVAVRSDCGRSLNDIVKPNSVVSVILLSIHAFFKAKSEGETMRSKYMIMGAQPSCPRCQVGSANRPVRTSPELIPNTISTVASNIADLRPKGGASP